MKSQPNRDYVSCDDVQTPKPLAVAIARHFKPHGFVLEPCMGDGAFMDELEHQWMNGSRVNSVAWCEIKRGVDFLKADFVDHFDWIITNPPWSLIRPFLQRSMQVADNVVFLMTVNHAWTKARVRDVREAGFGMKEILLCEMPKEFPQSGFQLGAVHFKRDWTGDVKISWL